VGTGGDSGALAKVLDPEWNGSFPCALMIAPGGKIVYRHSGGIDPEEFKRFIVGKFGRFCEPKRQGGAFERRLIQGSAVCNRPVDGYGRGIHGVFPEPSMKFPSAPPFTFGGCKPPILTPGAFRKLNPFSNGIELDRRPSSGLRVLPANGTSGK
jgi:hypothetical protein